MNYDKKYKAKFYYEGRKEPIEEEKSANSYLHVIKKINENSEENPYYDKPYLIKINRISEEETTEETEVRPAKTIEDTLF